MLIQTSDSACTASDDADVNSRLSEFLGRKVALCPLHPAGDKSHYRRAQPGASVMARLSRFQLLRPHLGSLIASRVWTRGTREMFSRRAERAASEFSL